MFRTKNKKVNCYELSCHNRALSVCSQNRLELSPQQIVLPGGFIKIGGQFYEVWTLESLLAQNLTGPDENLLEKLDVWDEKLLKELSLKRKNKKIQKKNPIHNSCQLCGSNNKLNVKICEYCGNLI